MGGWSGEEEGREGGEGERSQKGGGRRGFGSVYRDRLTSDLGRSTWFQGAFCELAKLRDIGAFR